MTVDAGLDEEILLFHDFEYEAPCESVDKDCENPAEWRLVRRCCGLVSLLCDPCKTADEEWLNDWATIGSITCTECHAKLTITKYSDAYTTIERI